MWPLGVPCVLTQIYVHLENHILDFKFLQHPSNGWETWVHTLGFVQESYKHLYEKIMTVQSACARLYINDGKGLLNTDHVPVPSWNGKRTTNTHTQVEGASIVVTLNTSMISKWTVQISLCCRQLCFLWNHFVQWIQWLAVSMKTPFLIRVEFPALQQLFSSYNRIGSSFLRPNYIWMMTPVNVWPYSCWKLDPKAITLVWLLI